MSKKDDKERQHFKIARSIIGLDKDVKFIAGVQGRDWTGIWAGDDCVYVVRYDWEREYYVINQYKKGWIEVYALEDLPSKYQKEKI